MRVLYSLLLAAILCVGCQKQSRMPHIEAVAVESQLHGAEEFPSQLLLHLKVDNPSPPFKLVQGRVRVSYKGCRVAMLTLQDKVRVRRGDTEITLPLRLNLQHSSQTMQLRAALRQGITSDVELEWEIAVRRGLVYLQRQGGPIGFDELAGESANELRTAVKEILSERGQNIFIKH